MPRLPFSSPRPFVAGAARGMMLLSAGLLSVLIVLALQINSEWMTDLDTSVRKWFTTHEGSKGLRNASRQLFAFIGWPLHVAIAAVLSGMLLAWRARSPLQAVVVIGAVGTGAVLDWVFKALVTRTPDNLSKLYDASPQDLAQITEHAHTFPSGHVIGTATLLGMIAVCASVGRRRPARTTWAAFVLFGVLFVAALALYVHAHLFADVIGGMALGGSIVAAGAALISALHPIERRKRPHWVGDCVSRDEAYRPNREYHHRVLAVRAPSAHRALIGRRTTG